MDRLIKSAITPFVIAAAFLVLAPIMHEKATSVGAQSMKGNPACQSSGIPMFALANVSPAGASPSPTATPAVNFYNLDYCGYTLQSYPDPKLTGVTHCELLDSQGLLVTQFYYDPPMYDTEGTNPAKPIASPPSCSH